MDEHRQKLDDVFSKRVRAGKKRTYFFDIKKTRNNDYYLTITESKRDFKNPNYYIKHKIFLYKEDFNKFLSALEETIDHVKTELLPDFQFDKYDEDTSYFENNSRHDNQDSNTSEEEKGL